MRNVSDFWKRPSDVAILVSCVEGEKTQTQVSRETGVTYAFAHRRIRFLERRGFLERRKVGRCVFVRLTEKGRRMAALLKEADRLWRDADA